jgi:Ser/Thr protein kinase RdoA (MazF antagonist)
VDFRRDGSWSTYVCVRCGYERFVEPGTAWCFAATADRGARWFVKLTRPGALGPGRVEFAGAISRALADLGLPVPRPLSTLAGAFGSWLDGLQLVVFEFVDGAPLAEEDLRSAQVMRRVAQLVAAVHRSTSALVLPIPFVETLQVYPDGLRRCLAQLDTGPTDRLAREARDLVWPRRAALLARLQRLQALGDRVRSRSWDTVLCHGDLISDNLLSDRGDRLWLVDWDAAVSRRRCSTSACSPVAGSCGSSTTTG